MPWAAVCMVDSVASRDAGAAACLGHVLVAEGGKRFPRTRCRALILDGVAASDSSARTALPVRLETAGEPSNEVTLYKRCSRVQYSCVTSPSVRGVVSRRETAYRCDQSVRDSRRRGLQHTTERAVSDRGFSDRRDAVDTNPHEWCRRTNPVR